MRIWFLSWPHLPLVLPKFVAFTAESWHWMGCACINLFACHSMFSWHCCFPLLGAFCLGVFELECVRHVQKLSTVFVKSPLCIAVLHFVPSVCQNTSRSLGLNPDWSAWCYFSIYLLTIYVWNAVSFASPCSVWTKRWWLCPGIQVFSLTNMFDYVKPASPYRRLWAPLHCIERIFWFLFCGGRQCGL